MRTVATLGDIYGPDSGSTFYNANNGPAAAAGTSSGGMSPDMSGASSAASISPISVLSGWKGTILGSGVFQWFMIAFVAIGIYALAKKHVPSVEEELGTPRISIPSFLSVGVQAFLFLAIVKTLLKKYNVPGLSGLAANA